MTIHTKNEPIYEELPTPDYVGHFKVGAKRATELAIESARGSIELSPTDLLDLPVGAVALLGRDIIGEGFAIDQQTGEPHLHAEVVAIKDAKRTGILPDMIVSTMEPCLQCVEAIGEVSQIKRVGFIVPRTELETRKLVNPHTPASHPRIDILQIEVPDLLAQNLAIFGNTKRDCKTGRVALNAIEIILALDALRTPN